MNTIVNINELCSKKEYKVQCFYNYTHKSIANSMCIQKYDTEEHFFLIICGKQIENCIQLYYRIRKNKFIVS